MREQQCGPGRRVGGACQVLQQQLQTHVGACRGFSTHTLNGGGTLQPSAPVGMHIEGCMLMRLHHPTDHALPFYVRRLCSTNVKYNSILGSSMLRNNATYGGGIYVYSSQDQCVNPDNCFTVSKNTQAASFLITAEPVPLMPPHTPLNCTAIGKASCNNA